MEEDPSKGIATLREYVRLRRQMLMLAPEPPEPPEPPDRLRAATDPRVLWPILRQNDDPALSRAKMTAFVEDESHPATCSGKKGECIDNVSLTPAARLAALRDSPKTP
jgi:hypothetical protein